jgi:hypothetical protein
MAKLHSYYVTNARNELNYIGQDITDDEFEQFMQDYAASIDSEEDMFSLNDEDDLENEDDDNNNEEDVVDLTNIDENALDVDRVFNLRILVTNNSDSDNFAEPESEDHGNPDFNIDDILNADSSLTAETGSVEGNNLEVERGEE